MSELSFLIDLFMNHKLSRDTKLAIAARIKEVEARLPVGQAIQRPLPHIPNSTNQSASTIALMEKHAEMNPMAPQIPAVPIEAVAQTPLAQQAMLDRQRKILGAGKIDKGLERPPKF